MAQLSTEKKAPGSAALAARKPGARAVEKPLARRWRPFDFMRRILHRDPFEAMAPLRPWREADHGPDFSVKETKDAFIFKADIPGIDAKDIDVELARNRLTVSGLREEQKKREGETYYTYEHSSGSFSRSFTLPPGADLDRVDADLKKGVLTIVVSKIAAEPPKKVEVKLASFK